jgi:hypothetical protein
MTTCLCQPRPSAACVERNWLPRAHTFMMGLPRRYFTADRLLIAALEANGLVERSGARIQSTPLGNRLFKNQRRKCAGRTARWGLCRRATEPLGGMPCDARPDIWKPAPGSVAFRRPCTI